jgi:hypothetical protein
MLGRAWGLKKPRRTEKRKPSRIFLIRGERGAAPKAGAVGLPFNFRRARRHRPADWRGGAARFLRPVALLAHVLDLAMPIMGISIARIGNALIVIVIFAASRSVSPGSHDARLLLMKSMK